ncbi:ATP-binding protein [Noviherbaspirillum soli]|uniref:ATP-binding protein n=1 Tax=Noviherbaspirillum soli TaxID=1064518 RepID=UPI00188CAC06|nr:ATP-binding protein [Noviherbaspirillum soli]
MATKRPQPQEVFTPRGEYNPKMYANRSELEDDFEKKILRKEHIIIYGESGCGKSWLYTDFFKKNNVYYKVVNLAHASRNKSIAKELQKAMQTPGAARVTGYDEKKAAQAGLPGVASGGLEHNKKYQITDEDPLQDAIKQARKDAGNKKAFIVLDNLERIFDKRELMDELADIITVADDPNFVKENVKFLIVGVPNGIKDFFNKTPSYRTVANRLIELKEVARLSKAEAEAIVLRGFKTELGYEIAPAFQEELLGHILWVTDKIPQALHEYCLELAQVCEKDAIVNKTAVELADRKWLDGTLSSSYTLIESHLNERDTKIQRRNQVLYVLGQLPENEFKTARVEAEIRKIFYQNDSGTAIGGVGNCLSELAEDKPEEHIKPVLRKAANGDAFIFVDPQSRMCIRAMLRIEGDKVDKIPMDRV